MPERILVCDDDPQIRRALALILREAGYEVLLTASPEEALDRAAVAGAQLAIVDLARHAVWIDDEEIHLTPTAFALLRVLVINRGLLLTHRQLLTEVWGIEYADATPVLRTLISNLRQKLQGAEQQRRLIRTDSGIGYRFVG